MNRTTALAATLITGATLSTPVLAGTPAWQNDDVSGDITFYTNRTDLIEQGHYDRWEEAFKAKYPGVTEVEVIGLTDYQGQLQPRMQSRDFGDVVMILDSIPRDQYSYFFESLNDLGLAGEIYFEDRWSVNGQDYGYTQGVSAEGLVYHKPTLEKAGVDVPIETVDELHEAARKIKATGSVPLAINMGAGWPMQQWDKLAGLMAGDYGHFNDMLDIEAPYAEGQPNREAIEFLKVFFENGWTEGDYVSNNWEESKGKLANGDFAMWFFGNWSIPQVGTYNDNWQEEIGFMPIPVDNSGQPKALLSHDWGYGVSAFSDNKTTAKAWVRFLIAESDFAHTAGFIPPMMDDEASMPQLAEIMSYEPDIIEVEATSSQFTEVANRARLDIFTGTYIRDLLLADNFDKEIDRINRRWENAVRRVTQ
ncbi:ABC transporter substrate-binding protein [Saccharospirillum salsuginis]|uniref:Sugar ABC transporter substrate-binding protein n=1 Tax=Saccharospirillum salsuginis TaxID=418750 RepID=A0A918K498_9GAMM|nr:ABC transporter substrate-binding protein [Saccharospirillum salsuginis]GGX49139.1 sugar ABC transporter substrate-binding protein [Saccharospirillum salsuginis]